MKIEFHKRFVKAYSKLTPSKRAHVDASIRLFQESSDHPTLRMHELQPKGCGVFSISAGGDLRLHFVYLDNDDDILFTEVGTHAQLYG